MTRFSSTEKYVEYFLGGGDLPIMVTIKRRKFLKACVIFSVFNFLAFNYFKSLYLRKSCYTNKVVIITIIITITRIISEASNIA